MPNKTAQVSRSGTGYPKEQHIHSQTDRAQNVTSDKQTEQTRHMAPFCGGNLQNAQVVQ